MVGKLIYDFPCVSLILIYLGSLCLMSMNSMTSYPDVKLVNNIRSRCIITALVEQKKSIAVTQ